MRLYLRSLVINLYSVFHGNNIDHAQSCCQWWPNRIWGIPWQSDLWIETPVPDTIKSWGRQWGWDGVMSGHQLPGCWGWAADQFRHDPIYSVKLGERRAAGSGVLILCHTLNVPWLCKRQRSISRRDDRLIFKCSMALQETEKYQQKRWQADF